MTQQLRFAALCRVSDVSQAADRKTSLQSQTKQIEDAAKSLKGTITKWFRGQEHGTTDYERKMLGEMIADSGRALFDAIIVADLSRWSRDNKRSKGDLETLKANGIKFYVLTMEYNLFDPAHRFLLGMTTESNEFFAEMQNLKMVRGKIDGARNGVHTLGPKPYARYYDRKDAKWCINELEQHKIEKAIKSYLNSECTFDNISEAAGMDRTGLYRILKGGLGDKWKIHFKSKKWGIDEVVVQEIPRLVPPDVEAAVMAKIEANKTSTHGQHKHFYLLGRMVFCGHCNGVLEGHTVNGKWSYYRHKNKTCPFQSIRAQLLDGPVMEQVFELFGDTRAREQAMKNAVTDLENAKKLRKDLGHLENRLDAVGREEDRLIDMAAKGLFTNEKIEKKITDIRGRETTIKHNIEITKKELEKTATEEQIKKAAKDFKYEELAAQIHHSFLGSKAHLNELTREQRRSILQFIFKDRFIEGGRQRRSGVYVRKSQKGWRYDIKGTFQKVSGRVDLTSQKRRNTQ